MKTKTNLRQGITLITILLMLIFNALTPAADSASLWPYANETKEQRDARMQWWRDARFGMFIHWGVYSVTDGLYNGQKNPGLVCWSMHKFEIPVAEYKKFSKRFNPTKYNPEDWVLLAKKAGMKYIVITTKHHEGFAMFDSKVTDWDVVDATPYGKDLIKPLVAACRKHKMPLGFYYSQSMDWCHKGGAVYHDKKREPWDPAAQAGDMNEYIRSIAAPQVKELLGNYGDVAIMWWDTGGAMTKEGADMILPAMKLQPDIIINNRLGGGYVGDFNTPEQHIPATGLDYDWESCMTMNRTWGYKSYDNNWKSGEELLRNLVDIASKGGNYLLNVGPMPDGEIPAPSVERLNMIGEWMQANSESIYGTTASPFTKLVWGRCTKKVDKKGATLYLHIFDWPTDGKLVVPGLKNQIYKAYYLATKKPVKTSKDLNSTILMLDYNPVDKVDSVIVLKIKGQLDIERILPKQDANGIVNLSAIYADIHNFSHRANRQAKIVRVNDQYCINGWRDTATFVEWQFLIDRPGSFEIVADAATAEQKTQFEIKCNTTTFNAEMNSTGGYNKFAAVKFGKVRIEKAGEYTFRITPVKDGWQPMDILSIQLKPEIDKQ